jgi:hypothetical protein
MSVRARWILAGVLGAIGVIALIIGNAQRNECNSFLGQLAQSDPSYHRKCVAYAVVWLGSLPTIAGAILVGVSALIGMTNQPRYGGPPARFPDPPDTGSIPPSNYPGWYPDPWNQAPLRWFDGTVWTPHVSYQMTGPESE